MSDLFIDANGEPRIVRGVGLYSSAPRLAELAARIGFDTVWIELEHGPTDFALAETICHAVESAGGVGTIRVPDQQRTNVLRALEVGARIVVVPMVDTAEQAASVVRSGKFPPRGERGFNTRSRGVGYGLAPSREIFDAADARTHLFVQIESATAVANVGAICAVEGLSGIFLGPGDLSASMGCFGDLTNAKLIRAVTSSIKTARAAGKHAGILVSPGPMLDAAIDAGADLVFAGGDVTNLVAPWRKLLASIKKPKAKPSKKSAARRRPGSSGR